MTDAVLSQKERAEQVNTWREWRVNHLLPELMREQGLDMWLIINREWIEDPVFFTLVQEPMMASPGCTALFFQLSEDGRTVNRYSCSPHGRLPGYEEVWTSRETKQFDSLAAAITTCKPKTIGINVSSRWGYGDGLTASLRDDLEKSLGPDYSARLVSAGDLCVRWLETRSPDELDFYQHAGSITHQIIAEFFSSDVVIPGETTVDDLCWWTRQRVTDLGLETWFQPTFSIARDERRDTEPGARKETIQRGDVIHSDFGIAYCGLCTDMQWWAYVCRDGEDDAPQSLKDAMNRALQVADIFMAEFKAGATGLEIARKALEEADSAGLRPSIYSHPVGVHGHGAGTTFNTVPPERQDERNVLRWDYPLYLNTCYAIELSSTTSIPDWGNQDLTFGFEETAAFTGEGCQFIDGHQTEYILIK